MSEKLDWRTKLTARTLVQRLGYGYGYTTLLRKFKACDYPYKEDATDSSVDMLGSGFKIWPYLESLLTTTDPAACVLMKDKEIAILNALEGDIAHFKKSGSPDECEAICGTKDAIMLLGQITGLSMRKGIC